MDQLTRLALSIHVFTSVLEQILTHQGHQVSIPTEICKESVERAESLLNHILKQNEIVINVSQSGAIVN